MTFEEVWGEVKGLPDTAMTHIPEILSRDTKKRLAKMKPGEISEVVNSAIDEVNHGSITPLDTLIKRRILSAFDRLFI